ncbi:MAG: putative membrane protein [Thermodesulfobacterium sp.]|uniref:Membrane protein n=1 Tax=Candidatus Thermodesulfobacterium syntrophicum TaxID=3060442 RepID=A0AAE3TFF4_9BACT|nr:putative membrane protein [Candidatus Thermodesulfobacterium syntrophicum]
MNGNLSTPKLIGGIGAILLILTITPHFGAIAGLAGIVLILISFNMFSKIFNDPQIFKNALVSFILSIIGGFVIFLTVGITFFSILTTVGSEPHFHHAITNIGIGSIFALIIIYALLIVSAHYLKSAFYLLSSYTGVNLYKTGGLLYFIGTILMIIVIGVLVNLVAWVLIAVAFFTTPEEIKSEV